MAISEFDLIRQFFTRPPQREYTQLSVGDDCALLDVPAGYQLAITTDTMVEGVHFFADVDPEHLGHKLLAVNLSDLASMGAEPIAISLALTLPSIDEPWLAEFSHGLFSLAERYKVDLIGGDTTSGALTLSIQAMGLVPIGEALKRSTAQVGDLVYMTGCLGDGGLGLKIKQGFISENNDASLQHFNCPRPRVNEGLFLRGKANACVDISDGLLADLGHILARSGVGAEIDYHALPLSKAVLHYIEETGDWQMPLSAGDDYELCFTIAADKAVLLGEGDYHCIGHITEQQQLSVMYNRQAFSFTQGGFEHFSR